MFSTISVCFRAIFTGFMFKISQSDCYTTSRVIFRLLSFRLPWFDQEKAPSITLRWNDRWNYHDNFILFILIISGIPITTPCPGALPAAAGSSAMCRPAVSFQNSHSVSNNFTAFPYLLMRWVWSSSDWFYLPASSPSFSPNSCNVCGTGKLTTLFDRWIVSEERWWDVHGNSG